MRLSIRDEATGGPWRVWPHPDVIPPGAVREKGRYLFELVDDPDAGIADLYIDDQQLEALRTIEPNSARWRWSPGFHAGAVEAELRHPGGVRRRIEITTDPDIRKLTRSDFDTMVREILADTFALFSLSSFRQGVARGPGSRPPGIARLEFLRSRVDELERTLSVIGRTPRRVLVRNEVAVPYHAALRATGPEILRSLRSGRILREQGGHSRLPPALQGHLPEKIRLQERRSSFDIPEHRQMASCLRSWASWLLTVSEQLDRRAPRDDPARSTVMKAWAARCHHLSRRVGSLAALPMFGDVGDSQPRLLLSSLFRNDANYRRFYSLYRDMNAGIAAVFGDFLALPLARTFELYELWCFLRLLRAAVQEYAGPGLDVGELFTTDGSGRLTVATGAVTVPVKQGLQLCFQKEYQEFWVEPDGRGSYSRSLKPDLVVARGLDPSGESPRLIVLDAKYRIEDGLNDALSSIHTYRDALVRQAATGGIEGVVISAYILTPHVPELVHGYRETTLPGRLFHPAYRQSFRFGAATLKPGMTNADVRATLRVIVDDATG